MPLQLPHSVNFPHPVPVIVPAYLISVVQRVAQGRGTVAIVTTVGIVVPRLWEGDHSQAFVTRVMMAISAGSMVAKYVGISERHTPKTRSVPETVLSVAGFAVAAVLSIFGNDAGAGCVRHRIVDHTAPLWSSA